MFSRNDLAVHPNILGGRLNRLRWENNAILDQVEVDYSEDMVNWTSFGSTNSFPSDTPSYSVMWCEVDGSASARYVRWTFSYRQWPMLAELEVIGPIMAVTQ
jgi:hypothetical protein